MTPLDLADRLNSAGVILSANGGKLRWDAPKGSVTRDLLEAMKDAKPILLKLVAGDWYGAALMMLERIDGPDRRDDLRYQFEERAAIVEYDGGMDRQQAERIALDELLAALCRSIGRHWEDRT